MIYDKTNTHSGSSVVTQHNKDTQKIVVEEAPSSLKVGDSCRILILSSPKPCEYQGRMISENPKTIIVIHHGREREGRGAVRYSIKSPAFIENLICASRAYRLHSPLEVELINISKSGVRFRSQYYSLLDGDRFQMRMKINNIEKLLIADVVNHMDIDAETSEYGCRFLIGSEKVV